MSERAARGPARVLSPVSSGASATESDAEDTESEGSTRCAAVLADVISFDVSYAEARRLLLLEFERCYVARMLVVHRGNITRAAAASGLARRNFQLIRARRASRPGAA